MRQWTVDAFATEPFRGNPACVVEPFDAWPDAGWMQRVAAENNLSETAFLLRTEDPASFGLRWFTPTTEVKLCGHATLASTHVLFAELGATAVFDGVGGDLLGKIAPSLPMNSTIYAYGFLGGAVPIAIPSVLFMMKNLTMRRFSNFESRTVKEQGRLVAALKTLESLIDDPLFVTRIGEEFRLDQVEQAMACEPSHGARAVLVATPARRRSDVARRNDEQAA